MKTTMAPRDLARYLDNLKDEREAIYLYERLADLEKDIHTAEVLRKLAGIEHRHASVWERKLSEAGHALPAHRPSWKSRALVRLAQWTGPRTVLPLIVNLEHGAIRTYDAQPEAVALRMPQDERSHARVFRYLAVAGRGIPGGFLGVLEGRHRAVAGNALRASVLGANDGLVSNLSLVMGVAGAAISPEAVVVVGLAGLLAGALSMAIGEWVSVQSAREMFQHQLRIEADELAEAPEEETEELALIYQAKGVPPEQARQVAERLVADPQTALDTLAREELGVDPAEMGGSPWQAAGASFVLFALGALVPVLPFLFWQGYPAVALSGLLSALALFGTGAFITLLTGRSPLYSGARQVAMGLAAAAVTFGIGRAVGVAVG